MEVVERGDPAKEWPREHRAPCCQSLLKLDPEDIHENLDYTGGHSSWFINCPVCGEQPDVPAALKHNADRWKAAQGRREPWSSTSPVDTDDPLWSAWATLSNDVTDALHALSRRVLFTQRNAVARALWDAGYRPNEDQINVVRERQQRALAKEAQ